MINNYVKDGLIPRPEKKKYSREHLASMLVICMLKQVLTMQNITRLQESEQDRKSLYEQFSLSQSKALHDVAGRVLKADTSPEAMHKLAIELSIEANARRITAENILAMLKDEKEKEKDKDKDKDKDKPEKVN